MNRTKKFTGVMKEKGARIARKAAPAFLTAYCYFGMYVPVYAAKSSTGTSVITSGFNSLYEIARAIVSSDWTVITVMGHARVGDGIKFSGWYNAVDGI